MATQPFPRFRVLVCSLAAFALAACDNSAPTTSSPAGPAAPSTPAGPRSATPNDFADVTSQLDAGGDLYGYLSTGQWTSRLSHGLESVHESIVADEASADPATKDSVEKGFSIAHDLIVKSGLEDLSGVGMSSIAMQPGLYRNKLYIHHAANKGAGLIWSLYGRVPHALTGPGMWPVDTAFASIGDFDLAQLINFLRQEVAQSNIAGAKQTMDQWQTQFAGVTGLQVDDVVNSLDGALGMVVTLDASNNVTLTLGQGQSQTLPAPRIALMIAVKNDLIFKQVDKMAGANPGVIKVDEPDLKMRTSALPSMIANLTLRPTVAQWNGYLILASDDKLIRDMIAVSKGGPGFKTTTDYKELSPGLPDQGNAIGYVARRFYEIFQKIQAATLAASSANSTDASSVAMAASMQKFLFKYHHPARMMAVASSMPEGYLSVSQGSQGSSQYMTPMAALPAAVIAGALVPAFSSTRDKATETASLSNIKQICVGCLMYANDNNGNFPPTLDALVPSYVSDRRILVSPLEKGDPNGYVYTPGIKVTDSPLAVVVEDKYAQSLKHLRIVGYRDGSARIVTTQ